jgi:hypothetical protein
MEDPAMRRGVYEMLYDRDPAFQDNLLKLVDQPPPAPNVVAPVPDPVVAPPPAADGSMAESPEPLLPEPALFPDESANFN